MLVKPPKCFPHVTFHNTDFAVCSSHLLFVVSLCCGWHLHEKNLIFFKFFFWIKSLFTVFAFTGFNMNTKFPYCITLLVHDKKKNSWHFCQNWLIFTWNKLNTIVCKSISYQQIKQNKIKNTVQIVRFMYKSVAAYLSLMNRPYFLFSATIHPHLLSAA